MKFFSGSSFIDYPDDLDSLRAIIFEHTLGRHQGIACRYLDIHFRSGGGEMHPILGDLNVLADEIYEKWNKKTHGPNKVPELIVHRLDEFQKRQERELREAQQAQPSCQ